MHMTGNHDHLYPPLDAYDARMRFPPILRMTRVLTVAAIVAAFTADGQASAERSRDPALVVKLCREATGTLVGTPHDDLIRGTPDADVIVGLGGDDRIEGRGGDDLICAGTGNDRSTADPATTSRSPVCRAPRGAANARRAPDRATCSWAVPGTTS